MPTDTIRAREVSARLWECEGSLGESEPCAEDRCCWLLSCQIPGGDVRSSRRSLGWEGEGFAVEQ